jgi:hypothetical protein
MSAKGSLYLPIFVLTGNVRSQWKARDFRTVLYRRFGICAFLTLSAFWRINNLHALNTPARFDPD